VTAVDPLAGAASLVCRGEWLHLLPERAVWWPAAGVLLVADVHLGKAATFRRLGQPVPAGTTAVNLRRIEALVDRLAAPRLVVLGDFLHAREGLRASLVQAIAGWRARQPGLRCTVVEGNHDRRAGALPPGLQIESVPDPLCLGPFVLTHGDRRPEGMDGGYRLAGHLHPAYVLRGRAGERLRLPCFLFGPDGAILPAFGEFTGQADVAPDPGDRVFVVGDGRVWPVPLAPQNS
jgi:DNA ligase-associated metallophosphoesterase